MKSRVLYLGGSGRSGTTLIARVIGQLPGHVAIGEVREIWRSTATTIGTQLERSCSSSMTLGAKAFLGR